LPSMSLCPNAQFPHSRHVLCLARHSLGEGGSLIPSAPFPIRDNLRKQSPASAGKLEQAGQRFRATPFARSRAASKPGTIANHASSPSKFSAWAPKSGVALRLHQRKPMSEVSGQLRAAALAIARSLQATRKAFISPRSTTIRLATPLYFFVVPVTVRLTAPW